MKITNTEIAEFLIALGTALKAAVSESVEEGPVAAENSELPLTGQLVQGSFEEPIQPSAEDTQSTQSVVNATADVPAMNEADKRILELEAELRRVKNAGSSLDLQPIKLTTNNSEVKHG